MMSGVSKDWQPKRILAVKLADLGDALLITPALRALKDTYPEVRLDVVTTNGGPALQGLPYIDNLILFNKYSYDNPREAFKPANLLRALAFFGKLALARYDTVILFHHYTLRFGALKFAALALATLAPVRVGLDNGKWRTWFLTRRMKDRGFGAVSEREYWLELVASLGAVLPEDDDGRPQLTVGEGDRAKAAEILNNLGEGPVLALAPGSGVYSLSRRWYPVRFAQVADALVERHGMRALIMGSKDELELAQEVRGLMRYPEAATVIAGQTSVPEAVALLEHCTLFIGNDGGLANLAGAAGIPGLTLFGPTNAEAWKPYGENMAAVQAPIELPCRPCLYRGLELGSRYGCAPRPCLNFITPEQVIVMAEKLLCHEVLSN